MHNLYVLYTITDSSPVFCVLRRVVIRVTHRMFQLPTGSVHGVRTSSLLSSLVGFQTVLLFRLSVTHCGHSTLYTKYILLGPGKSQYEDGSYDPLSPALARHTQLASISSVANLANFNWNIIYCICWCNVKYVPRSPSLSGVYLVCVGEVSLVLMPV